MRIGSLFSGIGGLELGLEWAGLGHTVWQVEQSEFCRRVLARHWPSAKRFEDVHEVGSANLDPVDLICGGFPCQDISGAGKGAGLAGTRSGLWYQFDRVVQEMRPEWVVVENVASAAIRWVDQVVRGLGQQGYEVVPVPIAAEDVGAPHLRRRVFLVAHAVGEPLRVEPRRCRGTNWQGTALALQSRHARGTSGTPGWAARPTIRRVDDGLPDWGQRHRALGNAVVPQCAEVVGWVIRELAAGWQPPEESPTISDPLTGK
jgi:DNA (cytosine-5)-methyltransferase 1